MWQDWSPRTKAIILLVATLIFAGLVKNILSPSGSDSASASPAVTVTETVIPSVTVTATKTVESDDPWPQACKDVVTDAQKIYDALFAYQDALSGSEAKIAEAVRYIGLGDINEVNTIIDEINKYEQAAIVPRQDLMRLLDDIGRDNANCAKKMK